MTDTLQQRAQRFLRWLHSDQAGYIEIVAGMVLDPERPDKIIMLMPTQQQPDILNTRKWFYLDPERPDLYAAAAEYAAQLTADYGNVYTGIRTYRSKWRNEANVNPGRVIFIDDAPAAPNIPYSASIRTSEASRHAYYKCAQNVTKDDARRAAAALGGDASGVDLTQLVRIPGTFNTKNNGRWPVEPEATTGTIYQIDQLRSAWPAVEHSPKGEITDLNMPLVEKHLANIDELLACSRSQLIKPDTQTGRILAGEMLIFPVKGKMDDSRSMNASAVGLGLLLRGYMNDEIAAVIFHLYRQWGMERDKGTEWCKADIARILAYVHTQHPEVKQSPTRYRQQAAARPIVSTPARSRARADRPTKFDPPMLFARYQAEPELCDQRRKARAAGLGISTATLDRLEDGLEALGLIEIEAPKGMPGRVILLGGVINIAQPEVLSAPIEAPAPEAAPERAQSGQSVDRRPQCIGETHPPPAAPSPRPRRAALVAEAFDALDGCARITDKRIRQYLEMNYPEVPLSPALLRQLATNERAKRRYAKQDARELRKARAMDSNALRRMSRSLGTQVAAVQQALKTGVQPPAVLEYQVEYADGSTRKCKTKRPAVLTEKYAWVLMHRAGIYAQVEAERQQQEAERIQRIGYSLTEQAEMLDLVDQARPDLERGRVGRAAQGHQGAVCPPQPSAPAGAAPAGTDAWSVIARLQASKAQRDSAAHAT